MLGALAGSAHVLLRADQAGFRRDMSAAERQFLASTGRMSSQAATAGQRIRRGLAFGAGLTGAVGGVYVLQRAINAVWDDMMQGQRVAAQTEAVIKSTGGAANVTATDIEKLADAWMQVTGVDDEIVAHGANVLLTFRAIRNEAGEGNKVFDESVEQLMNMAFALQEVGSEGGVSLDALQATALRLGKALQDPVRGVTALRRVGVAFTREEEAAIKVMVEHGQTMQAQKLILRELEKEFGNSARAAGETFPQALERLKSTAAEAAATYLNALIPALEDGAEWLQRQIDAFANNEAAQEKFREQVEDVAETVADLAGAAQSVADALGGWENVIKVLIALKFAKIILEWTALMRGYATATRSAALWTGALAIAQGGLGTGLGKGALGGLAGRLAVPAALAGATGTVAVATGVAVTQIPGAGGARQDVEKYPLTRDLVNRVAAGGLMTEQEAAAYALLDGRKSLAQQSPATLAKVEARLRKIYQGGYDEGRIPGRKPRRTLRPDALIPTTELSTQTQLTIAQAERSGNETRILRALHTADKEYTRLLRQVTLTDEERLALVQQQGAVRSQIRAIEEGNAAEAQRASDERKRAQEQASRDAKEIQHTKRTSALQAKVDRAAETEWLGDDLKSLTRLRAYYVQYRNTFKKGSEEWIRANQDVADTDSRLRSVRGQQAAKRDSVRLWRLQRAVRLAEETEGVQDDIRALQKLRAYWIEQRREATKYGEAWRAAQEEIDTINATIANAKGSRDSARSSRDALSFVNEFLRVQQEFGSNFVPGDWWGGAGGAARQRSKAVEVHQHFVTAPTDYHREARYAVGAMAAVFDG